MSQAGIVDFESANPQIPTLFTADQGSAIPVANELVIDGLTVANGTYSKPTFTTGSGNTIDVNVQVGAAITGAPADKNDAGLVSFDDTMFTVDANGYVQLIGGSDAIDTVTGDDAVAVFPDGAGNLNFVGSVVANATNAKPLYFDGTEAANTQTLEIQVSTTLPLAPADTNDAGICSFNSLQFDVDANGYVTLAGGSAAVDSNTGDDGVTVFPDVAGNFNWIGEAVANATHAKPVFFKDSSTANALDLDVQVGAAITGAPADKNDAGLVSFDDTKFTVTTHGYVEAPTMVTSTAVIANDTIVRGDGGVRGVQDSLMSITDAGVCNGCTQMNVDQIRLDGATISNTTTDASLTIQGNGTGDVNIGLSTGDVQLTADSIKEISDTVSQAFSNASGSVFTLIHNTAATGSANNANLGLVVQDGVTGESFVRTAIAGTREYVLGCDGSDSNKFKIGTGAGSNGTLSGDTDLFVMTTAGEINYPLQPAFLAYLTTSVTDVSGDGTEYTIIYDTEVFDQNSDFNLGTSTFTAPVTGKYQINVQGALIGGTILSAVILRITTSNRTYRITLPTNAAVTSTASQGASVLADMDAADTFTITIQSTDTAGKVDDVAGTTGGQLRNWVSAQLSV